MYAEVQLVVFHITNYLIFECHALQHVTCGSAIKLQNTYHRVRLHSHHVKYGSGSRQQSVTGTDVKQDVNSFWAIRGPTLKQNCARGEPIRCGQEIRLQHQTTLKNLHSHHFSSPLSNSQEVSAFSGNGEGDTGDLWKVVCSRDVWTRDEAVSFKHVDTGVFLGVSGRKFGRPIHGQMEVIGLSMPDSSTKWKTAEGIFIHPSDFNPRRPYGHYEL